MAFLMGALVVGRQDQQSATAPDATALPGGVLADIRDGAHAGNPDFFFLPPLADNPKSNSNFDRRKFNRGLRPVVRVYPQTAGCASTATPVFGPVLAAVDGQSEQYQLNWNTRASTFAAGTTYRLCVFSSSAGMLLGFVDVLPLAGGRQTVPPGVYAFQNGSTLPIKFRIEQGALCAPGALACTAASVTSASSASGDTTITLPSGYAAVVIPAGAVTAPVTIVIEKQAPPYGTSSAPECLPTALGPMPRGLCRCRRALPWPSGFAPSVQVQRHGRARGAAVGSVDAQLRELRAAECERHQRAGELCGHRVARRRAMVG